MESKSKIYVLLGIVLIIVGILFYFSFSEFEKTEIEVIVVPSFNDLLGGYPINRKFEMISPIFKSGIVDLGESEIYLLDGTYLGKLKELN